MKFFTTALAAALFTAFAAFAAEKAPTKDAPKEAAAKEETITGWGQCAKCTLGMTSACQNAIVVTKDGKEETIFLTQNALSQDFHSNLCSGQMEITVTGVTKGPAGEREMVASKIEPAKKK
ncbi:MAG: hypothetical protein JWQ83_2035 [Lacunisphaera sp.]|jgi:uncharacterized membrane protein|nr:hypothetical protein [Lacunisphaera sp.]